MAISGYTNWDIRVGGSDTNGGGFNTDSAGTDYSQQNSPQLSVSDGACAGTTTLTSAIGGFTSAMVGNLVYLSSGPSWYEITAFTDTNTVTIDRAGPNATGMTLSVGGSLATPGGLGAALTASTTSAGMHAYLQNGTYTLSNSVVNTSGGPIQTRSNLFKFAGYNTTHGDLDNQTSQTNKPIISAGAQTSVVLVDVAVGSFSHNTIINSIVADGNSNTGVDGFQHYSSHTLRGRSINVCCHALNCVDGFLINHCWHCEADNCTEGFREIAYAYRCVAHSCGNGFDEGTQIHCLAYENTTGYNSCRATWCTAADNTGNGFHLGYQDQSLMCLSVGNGTGFQFDGTSHRCLGAYMVSYNNTTDFSPVITDADTRHFSEFLTLTADPFTDAANDDYSLNDTAGGGALLKQLGMGLPDQPTDTPDFGAVQTNITGGGGGGASSYSFFS